MSYSLMRLTYKGSCSQHLPLERVKMSILIHNPYITSKDNLTPQSRPKTPNYSIEFSLT